MQTINDKVQLFEDQPIRTAWVEDEEEWYFSIVDVVQILTESADGRKYWNKLKQRLKEEGSQLVTNCHQLKMKSPKDGKDTIQMLLIQSNYSVSFSQFHPKKQNHLNYGWRRSDERGWKRL